MYSFLVIKQNITKEWLIVVIVQKIALVFTIIGAIVWGVYGLFDLNIITKLFGASAILEKAIYVIVGICGIINSGWFFMDIND